MKIQTKYILFVVIVHLTALVLSFFVFINEKWIFLISEIVIMISVYISWQIYQESIRPLRLLVQGTEAIADRDFNITFVETGKYEMDKLIRVYNLMIDQLRMERTKQEEQHYFLEKLIYTSPTGIMILDFDGKIERINPMALDMLGFEESAVINKLIDTLDHPVISKVKLMTTGTSATVNIGAAATFKVHKSHFIDRGFPRHFIMIEVLTSEILEAEKNAYGKVIRMMAHEVNNTIGPVNSIMQSALSKISEIADEKRISEALQIAVDRNNNLNLFMRNFADLVRLPLPKKQSVDITSILVSVARLMELRSVDKNIRFDYQQLSRPFLIEADQQQMEQVLINIVKNAMESIDVSGDIRFGVDPVERLIVISDTGKGIDDELSGHLFKPFFSTKKDGQGIGLTLIREVLFNHGFTFSLKTVGERTEFRIWMR